MQVKYTAIAAVVLALAAGAAQAKIAGPGTGNGELQFNLYDNRGTAETDDDKTLVIDLGGVTDINGNAVGRVNNWLSDNTTAADPVLSADKSTGGYSITVVSQDVVDFFAAGSFADMVWSITGGDSLVRDRLLTTVNGAASQQFVSALRNANGAINNFVNGSNAAAGGDNTLESINATSLHVGAGNSAFPSFGTRFNGAFGSFNNTAKVGEGMSFAAYWENSATGAGNAKSAIFGGAAYPYAGWTLYEDGRLVYSVPEPETYAMMGVGLLALGAIARRRRAARA
jgi:hypothetical protein